MAEYTSHSPWPTTTVPDIQVTTYPGPARMIDTGLMAATLCVALVTLLLYRAISGGGKSPLSLPTLLNRCLVGPVVSWYKAWAYLLDGPGIIQDGFDRECQSNGNPYEILSPDTRHVFVTTPEYVAEMDAAAGPGGPLSLYAASQRALQPQYTMHRFGWYDVPPEGLGYVRALRTLLTNHLPTLLPELRGMMGQRFEELRGGHAVVRGVKHSPVSRMIVKMVVLANAHSIFGEELAKNNTFVEAALVYTEQLVMCAEMIRLVPKWLAPIVGRLLGRRNAAQRVLYDTLMPIAKRRCEQREQASQGHKVPKYNDCFQWIMESSTAKTPRTAIGLVHELMAIWFASVHPTAITITFALQDLCLHAEYIEPIREEIAMCYDEFERTGQGLPLLDSFIKESARLSPVESISTRRCATRPFSFSDGTSLDVGDWACSPVASIMKSARFYPDPLQFSGFRFAPPEVVDRLGTCIQQTTGITTPRLNIRGEADKVRGPGPRQGLPSRLVDADATFYMWGSGRQTCPGRYYAVALSKVILGHIIGNYDFRLVDPKAPRSWTYRSSRIPNEGTMVVFTPREASV